MERSRTGAAAPETGVPPTAGVADRTPVAFLDAVELERRLDRRSGERRQGSWAGTAVALGTRELCHDLRQPLAAATMSASQIGRDPGLSPASQNRMAVLHSALDCLARMLDDHLEPPTPVLVDLARLAHDVSRALELFGPRQVEIEADAGVHVAGDPVLLARMLGNLLQNAQSVAGPAGRVRIVVARTPQGAQVDVEDSGPTDAPSSSGHGLGLMIAQTVAVRHGGHAHAAPSSLGGLRLRIVLPAVVPLQGSGECRGNEQPQSPGERR